MLADSLTNHFADPGPQQLLRNRKLPPFRHSRGSNWPGPLQKPVVGCDRQFRASQSRSSTYEMFATASDHRTAVGLPETFWRFQTV